MHSLKVGRAVGAFWLLTLVYLGLLLWADRRLGLLSGLALIVPLLPGLAALALLSFAIRYARWRWLLHRAGAHIPRMRGFIAYLSGFAFTATPGKVGELLRIRYFQPMHVAPEQVLSAFVYERLCDLVVVLALASIAATGFGVFPLGLAFVASVLAAVFLLARKPAVMQALAAALGRRRHPRLARLVGVFADGLGHVGQWFNRKDLTRSLLAGSLAWGMTAYAFVFMLDRLAPGQPFWLAFSLYPVALLAGAASMLPGGLGSTEAVLVMLLTSLDIDLPRATLLAVGIRLVTLWFATLLGVCSMFWLERHPDPRP